MKLLHLADLHFGKSLHSLSLLESGDQAHWADSLVAYVRKERPDAILISGDVYDRGNPSKEAQTLYGRFLKKLSDESIPVFVIAGNHDSGERLEYLDGFLEGSEVYVSGRLRKKLVKVTKDFGDGHGPVNFYLLPYFFPAAAREALGDEEIRDINEACKAILEAQEINWEERNVLLAHQTVVFSGEEPEHSLSETSVGGTGGIDGELFSRFDYVALGHIHGSQRVGKEHIRYAGSPLAYHFSEAGQTKGPLLVTLGAKGEAISVRQDSLPPLHRIAPVKKGKLQEIIEEEKTNPSHGDYVKVILTDTDLPKDARETLEALFLGHGSRLLDLEREFEYRFHTPEARKAFEEKTMGEHFHDFYLRQRGTELEEGDDRILSLVAEFVGGGDQDGAALVENIVKEALAMEEER